VPVENLVGELNKGWSYGKYLLGHERTGIAGIGSCKQQLARANALARQQGLGSDVLLQSKLTQFEIELMALEFTALRLLSAHQQSKTPAVEASMLKVRGTELRQAIYETLVDIAGPDAVPFSLEAQFLEHLETAEQHESMVSLAANCLDSRKVTIYGGTNEVQRNLIAKATLSAY
jgi:alkylation response protein AidB-like acyl-CoA dehydrogenase